MDESWIPGTEDRTETKLIPRFGKNDVLQGLGGMTCHFEQHINKRKTSTLLTAEVILHPPY